MKAGAFENSRPQFARLPIEFNWRDRRIEEYAIGIRGSRMSAKLFFQVACMMILFLVAVRPCFAQSCDDFNKTRDAVYAISSRIVFEDVKAIEKGKGDAAYSAALDSLAQGYARKLAAGDTIALRKLIGIGLFTAFAGNREPLDVTFRLACELAKRPLPSPNVLDPLTCAVIALHGSRRAGSANRSLAKDMVELAKTNLPSDPNGAAAKKLFDDVSPVILSCL
jgi:hypothetical protein